MSRYFPLQSFLAANPQPSVVLSYEEIEELLGRRLPKTAYGSAKRQWWANTETHSQALAWLRAGRKAKLDVNNDRVTFLRDDSKTAVSSAVGGGLPGLEPAAQRMLEDVAEERRTSTQAAAVELLNQLARRRRRATLDWFAGKSTFSEVSSVDLIREDRDAR